MTARCDVKTNIASAGEENARELGLEMTNAQRKRVRTYNEKLAEDARRRSRRIILDGVAAGKPRVLGVPVRRSGTALLAGRGGLPGLRTVVAVTVAQAGYGLVLLRSGEAWLSLEVKVTDGFVQFGHPGNLFGMKGQSYLAAAAEWAAQ